MSLQRKINFYVDSQEPLLASVKRQKLTWFRHVTHHDSLPKTILQGTLHLFAVSVEEMLDEQCPSLDVRADATTVHEGHTQKRLKEDLC